MIRLDPFTYAYVECAIWASTDGDGTPLDDAYSVDDVPDETREKMRADCRQFQDDNALTLSRAGSVAQNGHDFWLTRNRHGAGFWDRGYPPDVSRALTDAAHAYSDSYLYIGDDGRLYVA